MFKWHLFEFDKPKRSGFVFVRFDKNTIHIAYYDRILDEILLYDPDLCLLFVYVTHLPLKWAKMPHFSRSSLIDKGYVYL